MEVILEPWLQAILHLLPVFWFGQHKGKVITLAIIKGGGQMNEDRVDIVDRVDRLFERIAFESPKVIATESCRAFRLATAKRGACRMAKNSGLFSSGRGILYCSAFRTAWPLCAEPGALETVLNRMPGDKSPAFRWVVTGP